MDNIKERRACMCVPFKSKTLRDTHKKTQTIVINLDNTTYSSHKINTIQGEITQHNDTDREREREKETERVDTQR